VPLLVHNLECKQYLAETAQFGKEQSVGHALPIDLDLPYVTSQVVHVSVATTRVTNLLHYSRNCRRILIG